MDVKQIVINTDIHTEEEYKELIKYLENNLWDFDELL